MRDFRATCLNTAKLHACPVVSVPLGLAYGYCRETGEILIPRLSLDRLGQILLGGQRVGLRDIIRHEMAHALANCHPRLVRTRAFRRAFGAHHDAEWQDPPQFDPDGFLTEYACSAPYEDFAETVMVFTRHRGKVARYRHRKGLARKLAFVAGLPRRGRRLEIDFA